MMIANANHLSVAVFADGVVPTILFPFPPARQPIGDGVIVMQLVCLMIIVMIIVMIIAIIIIAIISNAASQT